MNTNTALDQLNKRLERIYDYEECLKQTKFIDDPKQKFIVTETVKYKLKVLRRSCDSLTKQMQAYEL